MPSKGIRQKMEIAKNIVCWFQHSVLERHGADAPFSIRMASKWRLGVWLAIIVSLFSVLILETEFTNITYHGGFQPIRTQGLVFLKVLVHCYYLYLTFNLLVFSQPLERLFLQQLILPIILFLAQFCYVLFVAFRSQAWLHDVSYGLFMSLFFLWGLRDWGELRNPNRQKREIQLWLIVEIVALAIFILFLFVSESKIRFFHLAPKDLAVGFSVSIFMITRQIHQLVKDENYVSVYQRFKENLQLTKLPTISSIDAQIAKTIKNIFDFGGSDGDRLKQILGWLQITPATVVCYEKDGRWEEEFKKVWPDQTFITRDSCTSLPVNRIKEADLFVFSHVLYEERNVSEIANLIKHAKPGALMLFRGNGPNSIFVAVSFIKSRATLQGNRSHIWIDVFLKRLVKDAELERVDTAKGDFDPDAVVRQVYPIDSKGRIVTFLKYLYEDRRGDIDVLDCLAKQMKTIQKEEYLPCDDVIFIFKKSNS